MGRYAGARGFSLLELLVVIGIMGVMTAASVPTITRTLRAYRLENSTRQAAGFIQRARYEAIRQNRRVGTAGGWLYLGGTWVMRFGLDSNAPINGYLDANEPGTQTPPGTWIYGMAFSWIWSTQCGVPAGYANFTWDWNNYRVTFSPRGTVTRNSNTWDPNSPWIDQTNLSFITIYQWEPTEKDSSGRNVWYRVAAVAVTPAGRVRVFKFVNTGAGSGCYIWGGRGDYRWVS